MRALPDGMCRLINRAYMGDSLFAKPVRLMLEKIGWCTRRERASPIWRVYTMRTYINAGAISASRVVF